MNHTISQDLYAEGSIFRTMIQNKKSNSIHASFWFGHVSCYSVYWHQETSLFHWGIGTKPSKNAQEYKIRMAHGCSLFQKDEKSNKCIMNRDLETSLAGDDAPPDPVLRL